MALWHFHGNIDPEYKESVIITLQIENQPIVKILKICFSTPQFQKKKLYLAGQYRTMNYPAASGRSINPKKQKQDTPQAAGELTQKRLKFYLKRNNLHYKNYL